MPGLGALRPIDPAAWARSDNGHDVFERRCVDDATDAGEQSLANRCQTLVAQAAVVAAVPQRPPGREDGLLPDFYLTQRLRGRSSRRCSQPPDCRTPRTSGRTPERSSAGGGFLRSSGRSTLQARHAVAGSRAGIITRIEMV